MSKRTIKILVSEHCEPCRRVKEILKGEEVEGYNVEFLHVEDDKEADEIIELINKHNITRFPVAIIEGQACAVGVNEKDEIYFNCRD
jgi:glutaredoxin